MPHVYSPTVRRQIVARLRSGESVAAVAAETEICQATLFRWKRQALIDAGVIEGIPSVESDELAAANKRIATLEAELALTRDACAPFDERAVVPPKRRRAITDELIAHGHSARSACRITGLTRSLLQYHRRRPVAELRANRRFQPPSQPGQTYLQLTPPDTLPLHRAQRTIIGFTTNSITAQCRMAYRRLLNHVSTHSDSLHSP